MRSSARLLFTATLTLGLGLAGCSGEESAAGVYELHTYVGPDGDTVTPDPGGFAVRLLLEPDETYALSLRNARGDEVSLAGTWSVAGDTLVLGGSEGPDLRLGYARSTEGITLRASPAEIRAWGIPATTWNLKRR